MMAEKEPLVRLRERAAKHSPASLQAVGRRGTRMTVKAIGGRGLEFRAEDKNGNYIGTWHWTGAPRDSVVFAAHAVKPDERARALDVLLDFSAEDSGPEATVMVFHHGGAGEPISFSLDGP